MTNKPNCYQCQFRGEIPGDAHSQCRHPQAIGDENPLTKIISMLSGGESLLGGLIANKGAESLNIKGNAHGIRKGWFNWPYNFDPIWLESCEGFREKAKKKKEKSE